MRGEVLARNSSWRAVEFLVDTGTDRTVFSANVLETLELEPDDAGERIGGVVEVIMISTQIRRFSLDPQAPAQSVAAGQEEPLLR